ncbi:hypothetical protein QYE76_065997 [Lolium multiflorum]|uniref:F-box domain-containing protein n=1 Tax=Lolium multiflorum TaxID=4521 RepID=A0AAD8SBW6_LOLMU|nr:hypothetical protein QYE76_065997 [Lolium multiflorum]
MAGCDRLSALPDDLLLRVLHFAPLREAASTSALSTRWRGLYRSSGAVNLEMRVEKDSGVSFLQAQDPLLSRRDAFVSAAKAALVASEVTVTRFTFRVEGGNSEYSMQRFLYHDKSRDRNRIDVVADLLSHPAMRRVEELQLDAGKQSTMLYDLSFLCLPSENLRVLELVGCKGLKFKPPAGVFPMLGSLRLSSCEFLIQHLQSFIEAAPALTTLHLQSVNLKVEEQGLLRLRCPSVTALLLEKYIYGKGELDADRRTPVEIDAPRLRCFTYRGFLRQISLSSRAPDLARVDVHIFDDMFPGCNSIDKNLGRAVFWKFLHNFSNAKEMKLRLNHLEEIAAVTAAERAELLRPFGNLGRLELEGLHRPKGKTAAVAIANLLRCCPVLRDLRISLTTAQAHSFRNPHYGTCFLERKFRHDLDKSIHGYKRRMIEPMVSIDDEDADDDAVLDQEKTKCFGRKLIEFFVENALLLEEIRIDSGNGFELRTGSWPNLVLDRALLPHLCSLEVGVGGEVDKRRPSWWRAVERSDDCSVRMISTTYEPNGLTCPLTAPRSGAPNRSLVGGPLSPALYRLVGAVALVTSLP